MALSEVEVADLKKTGFRTDAAVCMEVCSEDGLQRQL